MSIYTPELGIPYVAAEWPHGLMCSECPHVFGEGESFTTTLYAFVDETPLTKIVCLACAIPQ